MKLTCLKCASSFNRKPSYIAKYGESKFCSQKCRFDHIGETVNCETCQNEFRRTPGIKDKRFCSSKCFGASFRAIMTVQCSWPECTSTIEVYKSQGAWGGQRGMSRNAYCTDCRDRVVRVVGSRVRMQGFGRVIATLNELRSGRVGHSVAVRALLFIRANESCNDCGNSLSFSDRSAWQIDHITPIACGGTNIISNLQVLCMGCHFDKSKRELKITRTNAGCPTATRQWHTHHQKDITIKQLREDNARLKSLLASYVDEEETCA